MMLSCMSSLNSNITTIVNPKENKLKTDMRDSVSSKTPVLMVGQLSDYKESEPIAKKP